MRVFKNGTIILIIGIIGVLTIIYTEIYIQFHSTPSAYSSQEIAQMDIPLVNINTATLEELEASPQMTTYRAKNIIAYRKEHGGFSSIEELLNVEGIGKKTYSKIAIYLTVE